MSNPKYKYLVSFTHDKTTLELNFHHPVSMGEVICIMEKGESFTVVNIKRIVHAYGKEGARSFDECSGGSRVLLEKVCSTP